MHYTEMEAAVLKNMHLQALQALREGPGGPRVLNDFVRVVFRKENF